MEALTTIGYGDRDGYERTDEAVRLKEHEHDDRLKDTGARTGIAGAPGQVRPLRRV